MVQVSKKTKKSGRAGKRGNFTLPTLDDLLEGHLAEVLIAPGAYGNYISCFLFVTHDKDVRQLLQ